MKHVLLISTSYPDAQTGSEAAGGFVADFAEELAHRVRVTVVAATAGESSTRDEGALRVRRFGVRRWPLSVLRPHHPADWGPLYSTLRDGLRAVHDVVSTDRPDYILALWALPSGHWAKKMLQRYGVPYGVWALGSDIWSLGRIPVVRAYLRTILGKADRCFADGLELAEQVTHLSGASCDFMPSARQLKAGEKTLAGGEAPWNLAFLGRWHQNKGVDIFLESLGRLSAEDWQQISAVRIHGGGPLEEEVRDRVSSLQDLGRPVAAGGYLDATSAAELIGWSDYMALPSRIESIPVIFSDAAQMGRPLIATPVGDLPGLFATREFGILARDVSVDSYTVALQKALRTPPGQFRESLAEFAREFDIADVAQRFAAYVEEVSQ